MKIAAVLAAVLAAALTAAALARAGGLKKRLDAVPAESREPGEGARPAPDTPPPSPWELDELARRLDAIEARLAAKQERETRELAEAREQFEGIRTRSAESLAVLEKQSSAIKDELGGKGADKEKVAELTKRIRTEQQRAMIKRFMAGEMEKENTKIKEMLELTPEQVAAYDKVSAEMMERFADAGSSFMDGEANPQKFMELVQENNTKMSAVLDEGQMKKYTDYQQQRWGNRGGGGDSQEGQK